MKITSRQPCCGGKEPEAQKNEEHNCCCGGKKHEHQHEEHGCCGGEKHEHQHEGQGGCCCGDKTGEALSHDVKEIVKEHYSAIARGEHGCGCKSEPTDDEINAAVAKSLGYSDEEIRLGGEANLGLGCGNPTALGLIREGETVLDMGSGAGFDAFLAARKVGKRGKVIGVDMTPEMIERARKNAVKYGFENVEFRLGDIEALPLPDTSVDVIISNCVINLAPDKLKVFKEAFRVLRPGGRLFVSDIVLLGELTPEQRADEDLIAGCVSGAILRDDYLDRLKQAGFKVRVLDDDKDISQRQYKGIPLESLKVEGSK